MSTPSLSMNSVTFAFALSGWNASSLYDSSISTPSTSPSAFARAMRAL